MKNKSLYSALGDALNDRLRGKYIKCPGFGGYIQGFKVTSDDEMLVEVSGEPGGEESVLYRVLTKGSDAAVWLKSLKDYDVLEKKPEEDLTAADIPINDVELSVKAYNFLKDNKVLSMRELTGKTEADILGFKGCSPKMLNEIVEALGTYNLTLKGFKPTSE
ncbi:MAG: hypothetical protein HY518_02745 [Candidatus Aenigmarchaeota archaeon]|nr:hypothetical protein [Candidatus Aenigmarchaeota archaeon]